MAVRPIFSIDIDTTAFTKFEQQFERYRKLLSASPTEWKKVTDAVSGTRKVFEGLAGAEAASLARVRLIGDAQTEAARRTQTLAASMGKVAESAKSVAGHILSASRYILQLAAGAGIVTGLLGLGGLWGIDRLAIAASAGRRSSLGLGLSFGEQRAFGVNYSRVVDSNQFLGGVNAALHDLSLRSSLYGAGLSEADLQGKDTAQVATALIPALKRLADQTPASQLQQVLQSRHLDQFISLQDFERIKALSPNELADYQKHFAQDTVRFSLTQQQLIAWQKLQVQLTRAGDSIEATLIRGLSKLSGPLADLSKGFTDIVDALLNSKDVQKWIEQFAAGMEDFAKYIGTPKFREDVETFANNIGKLATKITDALTALGAIPARAERAAGGAIAGAVVGGGIGAAVGGPVGAVAGARLGGWFGGLAGAFSGFGDAWLNGHPWLRGIIGAGGPGNVPKPMSDREKEAHDYFRGAGYSESATDALLSYIKGESGFNPAAFNPAGGGHGAQGIGQWRGDRITRFHAMFGHDPKDGTFEEQLLFMAWELGHTESATGARLAQGGSVSDLAAAVLRLYGRGPPDQEAASAQQRAGYARSYQQQFGGSSKAAVPAVYIYDRTGGSVVVSAAQLAT